MNNEEVYMVEELDDILFHLKYAQIVVLYLEEQEFNMKTVKHNLVYLIEDVNNMIGKRLNE